MSLKHTLVVAALGALIAGPALATGECPVRDAGPKTDWQTKETLEKKLADAGWKVRRIKVDGQCFEVYGTDAAGKRVEAYFPPEDARTGEGVLTMATATVRVWDPLVRLLHWTLVAGVAGAWLTSEVGRSWHEPIGWTVLGAVAVRTLWGLFGPPPCALWRVRGAVPARRSAMPGRCSGGRRRATSGTTRSAAG